MRWVSTQPSESFSFLLDERVVLATTNALRIGGEAEVHASDEAGSAFEDVEVEVEDFVVAVGVAEFVTGDGAEGFVVAFDDVDAPGVSQGRGGVEGSSGGPEGIATGEGGQVAGDGGGGGISGGIGRWRLSAGGAGLGGVGGFDEGSVEGFRGRDLDLGADVEVFGGAELVGIGFPEGFVEAPGAVVEAGDAPEVFAALDDVEDGFEGVGDGELGLGAAGDGGGGGQGDGGGRGLDGPGLRRRAGRGRGL